MRYFIEILRAATPIGALIVFALGIIQYWRAESWKRTEFVAKLYKQFSDDPDCQIAMCLLSKDKRKIFYEEKGRWAEYEYDYKVLCAALELQADRRLSSDEMNIRDSLDQFFIYIEQFERAIRNGLVSQSDVYPYFGYWIGLLKDDSSIKHRMDADAKGKVLEYMKDQEFDDAEKFFMTRDWNEQSCSEILHARFIQRPVMQCCKWIAGLVSGV